MLLTYLQFLLYSFDMGVSTVIKNNSIQEADDKDIDIEIISPTRLVGSHPNLVPFANNA